MPVTLALIFSAAPVLASPSCGPRSSATESLDRASAVFLGTAISSEIVEYPLKDIEFRPPSSIPSRSTTFEVLEGWKGIDGSTITVVAAPGTRGVYFEEGKTYLVYAYGGSGPELGTSICSRTRALEHAASDIEELGEPIYSADTGGHAEASTLTVNGSGGFIPENNPDGATFSIKVESEGTIEDLKLSLFNFRRFNPDSQDFFAAYGGLVDLKVHLIHVETGKKAVIIASPLNQGTYICIAGMDGDYTFDNSASTTMRQHCGSGGVQTQPAQIEPGTYLPRSYKQVTNLSDLFHGESVAGTWELFISDTNINTGQNQFITNEDWSWQLVFDLQ